LPIAALAALFTHKSSLEERALTLVHPEYASYRVRVPREFIPVVW
jgi:protein-S-isoprenylcysteine O-methyltransferase Ste14